MKHSPMQRSTKPRIALENLPEMVQLAFGANGPLAACLPYYQISPGQQDYALRVAQTFLTGEKLNTQKTAITLLEAETGTGKSLGYLIPLTLYAAMSSRRVAVSTYTLHLQRQLTQPGGDLSIALRIAEQLTGKKLSFAVRKGLRNFVSARRVDELAAAYTETPVPEALLSLQRWAAQSRACGAGGDLQEWKENHEGQLPLGLQDHDVCLQAWDDDSAKTPYRNHLARARETDLVFVTHALLLLNNYRWFSLLDSDERPLQTLVVDEADRLETAAEVLYKRLIPLQGANRLLQTFSRAFGADAKPLSQPFRQLRQTFDTVRKNLGLTAAGENHLLLNDPAGREYRLQISRQIAAAIRALAKLSTELALPQQLKTSRLAPDKTDLAKALLNLQLDLSDFHTALKSDHLSLQTYSAPALRWSPVQALPALCLIPLYPGRLTARLWQPQKNLDGAAPYLQSCILTSATLPAPGSDMQDFERKVGIYQPDHHVCSELNARFEPDRFGKAALMLADPAAPSPSRAALKAEFEAVTDNASVSASSRYTAPAWLDYCADMVRGARQCGGRVLVLTTSYHNAAALGECVPDAIVHQPHARLGDYMDVFRAEANAIWITPGVWEGLNLPGLIRHLVLTRLPFAPVDSARHTALIQCLIHRGMDTVSARRTLFALSRNDAKRRFRQGFGRGIRHVNDDCTVWIADPRFPLPPGLLKKWLSERGFPKLHHNLYPDFVACIPQRFREGLNSSYMNAKIWNYKNKPST